MDPIAAAAVIRSQSLTAVIRPQALAAGINAVGIAADAAIQGGSAILRGAIGGDYTHSFFRKYREIKTETKTLHAALDYLSSKQMTLQKTMS